MREIKFRAWDDFNRAMLYGDQFLIDFYGQPHEGTLTGWVEYEEDERLRRREVKLMQFTGLKDKNGKEIWEGDIVVQPGYLWFDDGKPNYRGTVEWIYSQWQVVAHCVNPDKRGISDGMNEGLNDDGVEDGKKSAWEVLGNIYENPELLK